MPDISLWPKDSMEEFVLKYENRLNRTAIAIVGNKADAEEIVQEVFVKVIEKQPVFESHEHEVAWLIRVTVNLCKSRLRTSWWKKNSTSAGVVYGKDGRTEISYGNSSVLACKIQNIYYEGYSTTEIAEILEQKESTVRSLLTRARQKLKSFIEEEQL